MEKKFIIDHLLLPHWKALAVAFVAVIIDGMADLFGPWPIKIVIDYVVGSHPLPSWAAGIVVATFGEGKWAILHFAAIATLAITALGAAASYTESYLTTRVGQWIMHDLRQELYHHIQGLSLSYYDRHKTGDLIGRMTNDVDAIQSFVSSSLLDMVVDVLTLGGMMAVMFYFNWHFTLIALAVAPLLFLEVYTLTGASNRGSGPCARGGFIGLIKRSSGARKFGRLTGLVGITLGPCRFGAAPRIRPSVGASSGLPGLAVSADRRAANGMA